MKTKFLEMCKTVVYILAHLLLVLVVISAMRYYQLRTGMRCHAPVIYHIPTGSMTYINAYGVNEEKPWELADTYPTTGEVFRLPQREDRAWCSSYVWEDLSTCSGGIFLPNRWCYLILDLYDLEHIQAYGVQEERIKMRDYDLEIEALGGGWVIYVE